MHLTEGGASKVVIELNRRTSSTHSEPGELKTGISQSHTALRTTQSLDPADLLSPNGRQR